MRVIVQSREFWLLTPRTSPGVRYQVVKVNGVVLKSILDKMNVKPKEWFFFSPNFVLFVFIDINVACVLFSSRMHPQDASPLVKNNASFSRESAVI